MVEGFFSFGNVFNHLEIISNDRNIICTSLYIGKLKELSLVGVESGDLCKLLKSEKVKNLTALEIENRVLSLEDFELISLSEFSKHLKKLKLKKCGLDEHGIKVLAESHQLTNLTSLDLCCNKLSNSGGKLIETSPNFSNLTELKLNNCDIGPGGFRQIQSNLKYLENFIDPSGDVYIKMVTGASFTIPVTSETTYKDITELLYEKAGYSFSRFVCISARKLLLENEQVVPGSLIYAVTTLRGG